VKAAYHPSLTHPGRWLWLLLAVPVVLGLVRLRFDVEIFDLLPGDLPPVQGLKLYQEHFADARELLLTIQAKDAPQAEAAARFIAQTLNESPDLVSSALWQPPWLEHPEQAAELMAYLWYNQPPQVFRDLTNRLAPTRLDEILATTREDLATSMSPQEIARLSYDPFGLTRLPDSIAGAAPSFGEGQQAFSSADGKFRLVFVKARPSLRSYGDCARWLREIKPKVARAIASANDSQEIKVGYTGRPAFVAEVAQGMEHDITLSVGGTAAIIAGLFWLAHRRVKPMLWLLTLLALILGCTLALGGLIFGTINVVSMGFAAILLGLAVDYAVVHYQEALAHPELTIPQVRRAIAPSIFWAAVTTITAFLVLNFGGLPGLAQLGTLVGLGVALAATIMIFEFLPPLFPNRRGEVSPAPVAVLSGPLLPLKDNANPGRDAPAQLKRLSVFGATGMLLVLTSVLLFSGLPPIDPTGNALRPRGSPAYAAMDQVQAQITRHKESLWLFVTGSSVEDMADRLDRVQSALTAAASNNVIAGYRLPAALWPHSDFQTANRVAACSLVAERELFKQAASSNGFAPSALALTERILDTWQSASATSGPFWPTNAMSRWIFEKFVAQTPTNYFAFGLLEPVPGNRAAAAQSNLSRLETELASKGALVSGWELLGGAIFARVKANMWKLLTPMVLLVLLSLYLAFRRLREILLSLAVLFLSGVCLLTVMHLAHWRWNLLSLMAIPLILGTGVDYSIFMQLALRRHEGDLRIAYLSVGRALLLCGGTAIAGFGSLAWSSNAGMASLGQVCAVGIAGNMLISIFLLPTWWVTAGNKEPRKNAGSKLGPAEANGMVSGPSTLYRVEIWRMGLWLVRVLPAGLCRTLARLAGRLYWLLAGHRRRVVVQNLIPALASRKDAAEAKAKELFQQFAVKLIDLWRYEAGLSIDDLVGETRGWEHFVEARAQGRGVLLLTPHLGNWEFGGPLMTRRGVALQVLTLAEPGEAFTRLRQSSRARWKIDTLVVGDDPLAFVEIIKRLEGGATVALLVDRPPQKVAIEVELFGRPFAATVAAAELARASGCVLLPVYLVRHGPVYDAAVLPAIPYQRAALRDRAARQELTQRIASAFEPVIREHLEQWYHFVPLWGRNGGVVQ
jgi:predicted RND superfamily exporter protein/lauroyl/myristoyl acyltransferase